MKRAPYRRSPADPEVVKRLVNGEHPRPRGKRADVAEAVRILTLQGFSDGQIGYRIGRVRRTVARAREAQGIPPAMPARGANQYTWRVPAPTLPGVR